MSFKVACVISSQINWKVGISGDKLKHKIFADVLLTSQTWRNAANDWLSAKYFVSGILFCQLSMPDND